MILVSHRVIRLGWGGVSALLLLVCLMSVWGAVRTVLDAPEATDSGATRITPPPEPTQHPRAMYAALSGSPLFGGLTAAPPVEEKGPELPPNPIDNLPETSLKLRLVGAVARLQGTSYAVIENLQSRIQKTHVPGDVVLPGTTLEAVYDQRVVIVRGGRREVLSMLQGAAASPFGATSGTRVTAGAARGRLLPTRGAGRSAASSTGPRPAIRRINANLRVLDRESFEREYGRDVLQAVTSVSAEPRLVNSQPSGVTLRDLGRGDLLESLGFERDDVVISVNGSRVNSAQDLAALGDHLGSSTDIRVQIIRQNLPRTLIYKVR